MSFEASALSPGRPAATVLEMGFEQCSLEYGEGSCSASSGLTNRLIYSDDFANAAWLKTNLQVDSSVANDAFGGLHAGRISPDDTSSGTHSIEQTISGNEIDIDLAGTIDLQYEGGIKFVRVELDTDVSQDPPGWIDVNLVNGTVDNQSAAGMAGFRVRSIPSDSAYPIIRVSISLRLAATVTPDVTLRVHLLDDSQNAVFAGSPGTGVLVSSAMFRDRATHEAPGKYVKTVAAIIDGGSDSTSLCYRTFATCQDKENYSADPEEYVLRFVDTRLTPATVDAFPCMKTQKVASTRLDPSRGLSVRAVANVTLNDFPYDDSQTDPYLIYRGKSELGTFFGKLLARQPYYFGRSMRLLDGYLDNEADPYTNFIRHEYVVESISGPSATGVVKVKGKDLLKLAADDRALCPVPSVGTLAAAIDAVTGTVTVSTGTGPDYDADPHIAIGEELLLITARNGDVLTVTRGQGGTTASSHDIDAAVQSCKTWSAVSVIDIVRELLVDFAGVDASYIPYSDWQDEEFASLAGYQLTNILGEPEGVTTLLQEIVGDCLIDLWWDDEAQAVRLQRVTQFDNVTKFVDAETEVLSGSLQIKDLPDKRLSRVIVNFGIRNYLGDKASKDNFEYSYIKIDADKESESKYKTPKVKKIFSRWLTKANEAQAQSTANGLVERYGNIPVEVAFTLDASKAQELKTGEVFDLSARVLQAASGANRTTRLQVIENSVLKAASHYKYKALAFFQEVDETDQTVVVIDSDQENYNLYEELGQPAEPLVVSVTINSGVTIKGNGAPAFTTGAMHPDSIVVLENNGSIYGFGGGGADAGVRATAGSAFPVGAFCSSETGDPADLAPETGLDGGDALDITIASVQIENSSGEIFGGGGGGGAGGFVFERDLFRVKCGSGGGGGRGSASAVGGDLQDVRGTSGSIILSGANGSAGSLAAPGAGGISGAQTMDGGAGGDWGEDGADGSTGSYTPSAPPPQAYPYWDIFHAGSAGGAAGYAVRLGTASIAWIGGGPGSGNVKGLVG